MKIENKNNYKKLFRNNKRTNLGQTYWNKLKIVVKNDEKVTTTTTKNYIHKYLLTHSHKKTHFV